MILIKMPDINKEQLKTKPSKRKKVFLIISIVLMVLLVLAILFFAYWFYVISGLVGSFGENLKQ